MSFTAVVMAAGQGTRMRSKLPKVLHDLCGRPMVHWPILAARAAGADRVIVVVSPGGGVDGQLPGGVETVVQPTADGTGGAVAAAADLLADAPTVVVLNGDAALVTAAELERLVAGHVAARAQATVATVRLADPAGFGRIVRAPGGRVLRIAETKVAGDASDAEHDIDEINYGAYAFAGAALAAALPGLATHNAQGERYLTDLIAAVDHAEGVDLGAIDLPVGVNDRVELSAVRAVLQRRINDAHMRAGVTLVDPATAWIDAGVVIGADTTLRPSVSLRGTTVVGAGCTIGPFCEVVDATLHDGATVGPSAYLRPGTVLRERAKVGTFVEVKNSDIGVGTKVPHLSYVGDADVGPGTNLGAATITANYDGRAKHRTTIGAGVRTSVDTTLVAPVTVGDGAYTGAGSVITDDVPAEALGIARARQTNLAGYAARARPADG